MNNDIDARITEIDIQIAILQEEKARLLGIELKSNPYMNLKSMANKSFGEGWSEVWVANKCPSLVSDRHPGYDFISKHLGRVELKSTRLPVSKFYLKYNFFVIIFYLLTIIPKMEQKIFSCYLLQTFLIFILLFSMNVKVQKKALVSLQQDVHVKEIK